MNTYLSVENELDADAEVLIRNGVRYLGEQRLVHLPVIIGCQRE